MFRIGDFSRIARVSCRLLRYYDELGLLVPEVVDSATGYRYYGVTQLARLNRILVLKELGLTLEQIGSTLRNELSPAELRAMLLVRRLDTEQALAAEAERLRRIEARIAQIDAEGQLGADDVVLRDEPERRVLTLRRTIPSFAAARDILRALIQSVPRRVPKAALGSLIVIAHAAEFEPDVIDGEFGYILEDAFDGDVTLSDGTPLAQRVVPAEARMATCVRLGPPEEAHLVTGRIGHYAVANGYTLAGPNRELFLRPPHPDRFHESVVEMQFPVAHAQ